MICVVLTVYIISYSSLKSLIYKIEKDKKASLTEYTALLSTNDKDNSTFIQALDKSLANIIQFYTEKECEASVELDHILASTAITTTTTTNPIIIVIHEPSMNSSPYLSLPTSSSSCSIDDEQVSTADTMVQPNNYQQQDSDGQDQRLIDLYIYLSKLKSFVYLNQTAFAKILKKYDKLMNAKLSESYNCNTLLKSYPFKAATCQHLDNLIQRVENIYNEKNYKSVDLNTCLDERLKNDRNLVWRERLGQERRDTNITVVSAQEQEKNDFGLTRVDSKKWIYLALSLALFIYLLNSPLFEHVEQSRCFAILVFSSVLWATEVNITIKAPLCIHSILKHIIHSADAVICNSFTGPFFSYRFTCDSFRTRNFRWNYCL